MNATYKLVELAKVNTNIHSDNGIAKLLGISRQKISNWKSDQSEANALNTLKLIKIAGLSIDESIELVEKKQSSQNGFANLSLLFVTSLAGIALLALNNGAVHCILCKIGKSKKRKRHLNWISFQSQFQPININLF